MEPATEKQGRPRELRGLDLWRHLHPHLQAVRDRLGRQGRRHDFVLQRPSGEADHDVRRGREDRRVAILALLLPQLRGPGPGRAARRHAGRRRLRRGFLRLHQTGCPIQRQDHGSAVLLGDLGVELLRRHAGEAEDRQAFQHLRRIHRALRQGEEGRRVALSRSMGGRRRLGATPRHLVLDRLQSRRHFLRQAGATTCWDPARSLATC